MGECFQSPAAGRQRHIYPGIHSFALYIFFLSSSQTSSSTSSASSSPSISPLSSLHALPLSAPGRVANCAQLKAKWEWTIGERAWKCASVFCERGEEQEGESIAAILSLSHTHSHSWWNEPSVAPSKWTFVWRRFTSEDSSGCRSTGSSMLDYQE